MTFPFLRRAPAKGSTADEGSLVVVAEHDDGGGVIVEVSLAGAFRKKVDAFLEEKFGYISTREEEEVIATLVEFGARSSGATKLLSSTEKFAIAGRDSSLHFKQYEYFKQNRDVAIGLRTHLDRNRELKGKLRAVNRAESVPSDEWDSWDEDTVNGFYDKYVFGSREGR